MFYIFLAIAPIIWIKPPASAYGLVAWICWAFIMGMLWSIKTKMNEFLKLEIKKAERDLDK